MIGLTRDPQVEFQNLREGLRQVLGEPCRTEWSMDGTEGFLTGEPSDL